MSAANSDCTRQDINKRKQRPNKTYVLYELYAATVPLHVMKIGKPKDPRITSKWVNET